MASRPWLPKRSWMARSSSAKPRRVRAWRPKKDCGCGFASPNFGSRDFAFFTNSPSRRGGENPRARLFREARRFLLRGAFRVDAHQRLGSREAQQNPGIIIEDELEPVGAVRLRHAPSKKFREVALQPFDGARLHVLGQVKIGALRPELAPHTAKKRAQLLVNGRLPRRDHFRDQQTRQNAVFFRDVPANRKPRTLFASKHDGVLQNQLPDVFESYGSLADLAAVLRGDGVEQMRSGHAARRIQIPAAAFDQVIVKQAKDVIRRNPAALRVDDAEAVGIAVSGEAGLRFARLHRVRELLEIFLGDVRARAFEENIAFGANGVAAGDTVFSERTVKITGAATVQRVVNDARRILFLQFGEANEFPEPRQIRWSDIHLLEIASIMRRERRPLFRRARGKLCRARLDVSRDFRQRRAAVACRKFQAVIFRGIMAGGEVDSAVDFAAANLASYCRSWCGAFAKQRFHAVIGEFRRGRARKLLGEKA